VWYADIAAAGGGILQLREWRSCLSSASHHLGYFTNMHWLVVKQEHLELFFLAQAYRLLQLVRHMKIDFRTYSTKEGEIKEAK